MRISAHQLLAFVATAQLRSFSKAADQLGVTQSALSQRIANLEKDLEVTVFIRDSGGPRLTESGELLLRYCQTADSLEEELLSHMRKSERGFSGVVRIGSFSSFLRSVLIPTLSQFLRAHPNLGFEFQSYQVAELPDILRSGKADLIVSDFAFKRSGIVEHVLGREEYVVIESVKYSSPSNIYLDNDPEDTATHDFFRTQGRGMGKYRRSFLGEMYGILDGVEAGLGRAVIPRHTIIGNSKVKVVNGFKPYSRPIVLHHYEQPYYSEMHKNIVEVITKGAHSHLK